jgi:hypothetical protein
MKTVVAIALSLSIGAHAAAQDLPPPPPPPADDVPLPPPPVPRPATRQPGPATATTPRGGTFAPAGAPPALAAWPQRHMDPPGVIGEGPLAPAGVMGAPVQPDERFGSWSLALGSGVAGRWGGYQLQAGKPNASMLLYIGAQADGLWTEGTAQAARLRLRMFAGGDGVLFIPSEGEFEAAYMLGRREFRFVLARGEAARYPGLAVQTLVQVATIPGVEGVFSVAGDKVRLFYAVAPVEAAYVWYYGKAHLYTSDGFTNENRGAEAATAVRLRATFVVPPALLLSVQGDYLRMWGPGDQLKSVEGSAGYALLDKTVLLDLLLRWESYTRRSSDKSLPPGTMVTADQLIGMASATLVF